MKIKCRLKVIFAERDIKQLEFAAQVGVSESNMSLLANNKSLPTLTVAYKISNELGISVEEIWIKEKEAE